MVRAGVAPLQARKAIAAARAAGQRLPTDNQIDAMAEVTEQDVREAAAWFVANPAIPNAYKLLLFAEELPPDAS
jgi:hypothetical protein